MRRLLFPYDSEKNVSLVYEAHVEGSGREKDVFRVTRSGRCYVTPEDPTKKKEAEVPLRKKVIEQEAADFLKFMQASEYKIVDQLRKIPAKISLLALFLSSEPHREALLNVLKEAFVPKEISARQVENIVGLVFTNQISFGRGRAWIGRARACQGSSYSV